MQNKRTAAGDINKRIQVERRRGSVVEKIEGTASQIARYDNHLNAIQVERRRGSVVEKIKGTASQIARYDNRLNEHKAATKGATSGTKDASGGTRTASSFKAAPQS
ncbi:unnamed protein product [Prunus armeniaca]|uniref:Uncharacterized protein n=1 Tax=Prunus armeniaca TaxID=36596 RepID=A0A6J5XLU8_PRUAR|nr:unnamed protein product [Prunus armeniaca]